ncbi:FecR family protein [Henriciella aquimarina]|uniref:FecR family protein n=1 Tax=Henriciella aquimarina TaxID=545261 RepID=UPI000A03DE55|nr:FecR domain-containing protein [Henriciella aquimarina]
MDKTAPRFDEAILEDAAEWLLRIEEAPERLTSEAFERWLHADPRHVSAFNSMANEWDAAGELVIETETAAPRATVRRSPRKPHERSGRPRMPWIAGGLGALAAAAVALVLVLQPFPAGGGGGEHYATPTGEIAEHTLADGSRLVLDAKSAATVVLSETNRHVTLESGRLFVDVEPDAARPFRVGSDAVSFTALGTAYAVERSPDSWRLEVYEGTVRLATPSVTEVYTAGTGATLTPAGLTAFDLPETLDAGQPNWTSARVVFDETTLADAVQAFERYTDRHVEIVGEELRTYQVSGVFRLTDIDAFLQSVEVLTGASLTGTETRKRLEPASD